MFNVLYEYLNFQASLNTCQPSELLSKSCSLFIFKKTKKNNKKRNANNVVLTLDICSFMERIWDNVREQQNLKVSELFAWIAE